MRSQKVIGTKIKSSDVLDYRTLHNQQSLLVNCYIPNRDRSVRLLLVREICVPNKKIDWKVWALCNFPLTRAL